VLKSILRVFLDLAQ